MKPGFDDLILEFETFFEAAASSDSASSRRVLLAEASMSLSMARDIWQDELKMLRTKAENLRDARVGLSELRPDRHNPRPVLRHASPHSHSK